MAEPQGALLGPKALEQMAKTVREVSRRMMNEQPHRARYTKSGGGGQRVIGKLDADLDVATAFADDPSTAVMSIWVKDSSGDLVDSGNNITVTNRYLYRSYTSGTICYAERVVSEWHIYDSDCEST